MISYGKQSISQDDINQVVEILRSDFLTQGPMIPRFEEALASKCNSQHAVAVNSATSALHIACMALDVGEGDWVWTSPSTFVASANCAIYCGAGVDFVDIDAETSNMSVDYLREKLIRAKAEDKLPKVVIPVHLCGQSCDMEAIHALGQEYGFRIIEDASHAVGGSYKGTRVGDCRFSDITVFSFHPVKIVTTGEGGAALTNDAELANRLRQHRSHGITSDPDEMEPRPDNEIWNYQQLRLGYNYRITDIQAALGISQLNKLDDFVARRHEIAKIYDEAFAGLPIRVQKQPEFAHSSYHLYIIRITEGECGKTQQEIYAAMWEAGIRVNLHYIPVHRQPFYEKLGFKAGYCPEAERYHRETISLPMYPTLLPEEQQHVISALRKALEQ